MSICCVSVENSFVPFQAHGVLQIFLCNSELELLKTSHGFYQVTKPIQITGSQSFTVNLFVAVCW